MIRQNCGEERANERERNILEGKNTSEMDARNDVDEACKRTGA